MPRALCLQLTQIVMPHWCLILIDMPRALCLQLTSNPDSHASLMSYPDSYTPCFMLAAMEANHDVVVALVASLGGVLVLVLSAVFCSWCFKGRRAAEDEEGVISKTYAVNGLDGESGARNQMFKRSMDDKSSIGSASSLNQRAAQSPMLGRKTTIK